MCLLEIHNNLMNVTVVMKNILVIYLYQLHNSIKTKEDNGKINLLQKVILIVQMIVFMQVILVLNNHNLMKKII